MVSDSRSITTHSLHLKYCPNPNEFPHKYIYLGKEYRAEVTCENGMCRPKNPNIPEACNYICGKGNCDHISKFKPFT